MNSPYRSLNRASTLASTVLCTVYGMDGRCRVWYGSSVGKEHKWKTKTPSCSAEFSSSEFCSDLIWWFGFSLPEMMKDTVNKFHIVYDVNQHLFQLLSSLVSIWEITCYTVMEGGYHDQFSIWIGGGSRISDTGEGAKVRWGANLLFFPENCMELKKWTKSKGGSSLPLGSANVNESTLLL